MLDQNKNNKLTQSLICLCKKQKLVNLKPNLLKCEICLREFKKEKNIYKFLNKIDKFYEGTYDGEIKNIPNPKTIFGKFTLWMINSGYLNQITKNIKFGSNILELGCAGGVRYLGENYNYVGMDLSGLSLEKSNSKAEFLIQGNCLEGIPFDDNTLDGIVSSFFWEHIKSKDKDYLLEEFHRVLKPNGKIVMLYDVATSNPFINLFKEKNKNLYKKLFLDRDMHVGYETFDKNRERFKSKKFEIVDIFGYEKTFIQPPSTYDKLLHFFKNKECLIKINDKIFKFKIMLYFQIFLVRVLDELFSKTLPDKWSRTSMVILKKN